MDVEHTGQEVCVALEGVEMGKVNTKDTGFPGECWRNGWINEDERNF